MPELDQKFEKYNLTPNLFLFEWVITLHSKNFSLDISGRLWDNIFYYGEYYIFKIALAICMII